MPEPLLPSRRSPFPGLRSFQTSEACFFFGREPHTEALLQRLARGRFLAVVGSSGGGKSSLVRAGLLPALYRGYLTGSTTRWRIAVMRPGGAPIDNLAKALAGDAQMGDRSDCQKLLEGTTLGLVDVAERGGLAAGESLLVVADQFEELFRFEGDDDAAEEGRHFVSLLLNAVDRAAPPVYIVLTMRYEYLADCAMFPELPEALNASQYLIPRLTRDQRRAAIERPLRLLGIDVAPSLVQAVLNEAGDDPYQLPVMQHALYQTYKSWEAAGATGDIELRHYEMAGGIAGALDKHANRLVDRLEPAARALVEPVFRCLTVTDEGGRVTRRPRTLAQLNRVVAADRDPARAAAVREVVNAFAAPQDSLLLLSSDELGLDTGIDISHESLIVRWKRLTMAARNEARSAARYLDLVQATLRHSQGESGCWRDPELKQVLELRKRERWNASWAEQYRLSGLFPLFEDTEAFLRKSRLVQLASRAFAIVVVLAVAAMAVYTYNQRLNLSRTQVRLSRMETERALEVVQAQKNLAAAKAANASATTVAELEQKLAARTEELKHAQAQALAQQQVQQQVGQRQGDDPVALRNQIAGLENQLSKTKAELQVAQQRVTELDVQLTRARADLKTAQERLTGLETQQTKQVSGDATSKYPEQPSKDRVCPITNPGRAIWADFFEAARIAAAKGELDKAVSCYEGAIDRKPRSGSDVRVGTSEQRRDYFPYYELAEVYAKQGDATKAREAIAREEQLGEISKNGDFSSKLHALKARLN